MKEEVLDKGMVQGTIDMQSEAGSSPIGQDHAVCTDVGRVRSENQDSFGFARSSEASLYIVADGMGGSVSGEVASSLTAHIVARNAFEADGFITENSLTEGIRSANSVIHKLGSSHEAYERMGTTIVALAISGDKVIYAHVGDSRIYFVRNGEIRQLTKDHTLIQQLLDSGRISAEQAKNHPISHVLLSSIGGSDETEVDVAIMEGGVQPGDKFVLCCDGLTNEVDDAEIAEVTSSLSPNEAVKTLVSLANHRGGSDNITVEIVEIAGCEVQPQLNNTLEAGQVCMVFSRELDEEINSLITSSASGLVDVGANGLEGEVISLDNSKVEEYLKASPLSGLLESAAVSGNVVNSVVSEVDDEAELDESLKEFDSDIEIEDDSRDGVPFDTMIFEGESVEEILEVRKLYLAAKAMGKERFSQLVAEAENISTGNTSVTPRPSSYKTPLAMLSALVLGGGMVWFLKDGGEVSTPVTIAGSDVQLVSPESDVNDKLLTAERDTSLEKFEVAGLSRNSGNPDGPVFGELDSQPNREGSSAPFFGEAVDLVSSKKVVEVPGIGSQDTSVPAEVSSVLEASREARLRAKELEEAAALRKQEARLREEAKLQEEARLIEQARIQNEARKQEEARLRAEAKQRAEAEAENLRRAEAAEEANKLIRAEEDKAKSDLVRINKSISRQESSVRQLRARSTELSREVSREAAAAKPSRSRAEDLQKWNRLKALASVGQLRKVANEVAGTSPAIQGILDELLTNAREHRKVENAIKRSPSFQLRKRRKELVDTINAKGKELEGSVTALIDRRIRELKTPSRATSPQASASAKELRSTQQRIKREEGELSKLLKERERLEKLLERF